MSDDSDFTAGDGAKAGCRPALSGSDIDMAYDDCAEFAASAARRQRENAAKQTDRISAALYTATADGMDVIANALVRLKAIRRTEATKVGTPPAPLSPAVKSP